MPARINKELNQYFEMIGLLYTCGHPDAMSDETLSKIAGEFGINAEELKKRIFSLCRKYAAAFLKEMKREGLVDFDFFFADEDDDFIFSLQFVCANHSEWFETNLDRVSGTEIVRAFLRELLEDGADTFEEIPPFDEIVRLLQGTGFSSGTCWKLMLILQSPKEKIERLSQIIRNNLKAYDKAIASVEKQLGKMLELFPQEDFLLGSLHEDMCLTPTLIYPAAEIISDNGHIKNSFIGLLVYEVSKMQQETKAAQKGLLPLLKALSDSSKFDILLSLLRSPKYNLELAEELHLSAATVSHHMNVLMTCRLVSVDKRDGRVYYSLSRKTIETLLQDLRDQFID